MPDILTDPTEADLIYAIETNSDDAFEFYVRYIPNSQVLDTPRLYRFDTNIPFFLMNGVLRPRLNAENVDAMIAEAMDYFQSRRLPMSWILTSDARPSDLGERLEAYGLVLADNMPGMAVDLEKLPTEFPVPDDVVIEEVLDEARLVQWTQALSAGYGIAYEVADAFAVISRQIGFGELLPMRNFVALRGGQPVAASSLYLGVGVAGIYCVAVVEEARRQGIGAAITAAPLRAAQQLGYRYGVLGASAMGKPVYQRMGFEEYCKMGIYMWDGASSLSGAVA